MARVRIPFYRVKNGNGFWEPKAYMREAGMVAVACGPDGPEAWAKALALTADWEKSKSAPKPAPFPKVRKGSLEEAFLRYRATGEWDKKAPRTQEEWERCWKRIGPIFGDVDPKAVTLEHISLFRARVERDVSQREAHRCIKIWRALWQVAAAMHYCDKDSDPSFGVRNTEPEKRQAVWTYQEVRKLVKGALRAHYYGLAAVMAVAWDSSLSPVDARTLTPSQRVAADVFALARTKTGRAAFATLSRATFEILEHYLDQLGVKITPRSAIFRNRSGTAYSKDTLGDDFRDIRLLVFGEAERRTLADFRRSGASEATAGGASDKAIGHKLANDFASNNFLRETYDPTNIEAVREVDEARRRARQKRAEKDATVTPADLWTARRKRVASRQNGGMTPAERGGMAGKGFRK